ncbi:uncharacterized protein LOC123622508 [Lemur catta]|uniref:uncharacterized protein LOC123622508 n=1 Tax=Lemur catta TaxID=9447 RepID=UPI001E26AD81|nr:uncharacterized protein LOC123622508 [Lemur catta]
MRVTLYVPHTTDHSVLHMVLHARDVSSVHEPSSNCARRCSMSVGCYGETEAHEEWLSHVMEQQPSSLSLCSGSSHSAFRLGVPLLQTEPRICSASSFFSKSLLDHDWPQRGACGQLTADPAGWRTFLPPWTALCHPVLAELSLSRGGSQGSACRARREERDEADTCKTPFYYLTCTHGEVNGSSLTEETDRPAEQAGLVREFQVRICWG